MSDFHSPDLMVIGDSLAQGTSTLSVTPATTTNCYASVISKSQGWNFEPVALPRPIVFDLEHEIVERLKELSILGIFNRIRGNIRDWEMQLLGSRSGLPSFFDNLAIAGHTISDTETATASSALSGIEALFADARSGGLEDLVRAAIQLHLKINTAFVYNPSGAKNYAGWTSLDWVRARKPKRLLVHFGHNDGVYGFGSEGVVPDLMKTTLPGYLAFLRQLDQLPKQVATIYVVLLPKLSAVANLTPLSARQGDGYFKSYQTEFPYPGLRVSGSDARSVDEQVKAINRAARELVAGSFANPGRIRFIDTYRIFERIDFKSTGDVDRQIRVGSRPPVDNRYLHGSVSGGLGRPGNRSRRRYRYEHGGLQSLDGMHPGRLGYAAFAIEAMKEMDLVYDKVPILESAYEGERLIRRYSSGGAHALKGVLRLIPKPHPRNDEELTRKAIEMCCRVLGGS